MILTLLCGHCAAVMSNTETDVYTTTHVHSPLCTLAISFMMWCSIISYTYQSDPHNSDEHCHQEFLHPTCRVDQPVSSKKPEDHWSSKT